MIKRNDDYAAWALLMYELDDAREALEKLVIEMKNNPEFSEESFRINLGHIYAHLNMAWSIRNGEKNQSDDRSIQIQFPKDIEPI